MTIAHANRYLCLIAALLLLIPSVNPLEALTTTGCHPITDEERQALLNAGEEIPKNGQFCDQDRVFLFGDCPSDPKAYLLTKSKQSAEHVQGLNGDFACRLYKFLKAADAAGMNVTLNSGYRSKERQAELYRVHVANGKSGAPVAPPGRSKHNFGLAYDLHYDGRHSNFGAGARNTEICIRTLPSCKWAHENAGKFDLRYPMLVEPWHVEPGTQVRGGETLPSSPDYWISDDGLTYSGAPAPTVPTSGLTNQIRQALGVAPQQAPAPVSQPSQQQTTQPQQICSPSFSCTGNAMYYQSSTCTREVYQPCPYGCAGNACAASSTSPISSTIGGAFGTSTSATSSTASTDEEDPLDAISSYLGGFSASAVDIGTSTSVSLALGTIRDIAGISEGATHAALSASSSVVISSIQPTNSQQTFTSADLSANPSSSYSPQAQSGFQQTLAEMRAVLEWALQYLKPFGGFQERR